MNKDQRIGEINAAIISLKNARNIIVNDVKPIATLTVVKNHIEKLIADLEKENDI